METAPSTHTAVGNSRRHSVSPTPHPIGKHHHPPNARSQPRTANCYTVRNGARAYGKGTRRGGGAPSSWRASLLVGGPSLTQRTGR